MTKRALKPGDIFEIATPIGRAYAQYTHHGEGMGQVVRVLPGVYQTRRSDFAALAQQKELYFVFYTLEYALRARQVEILSNQPVPEWAQEFPLMRKRGVMDDDGRTLNWVIGHGLKLYTTDDIQRALHVGDLTPDQRKISINVLRSHPAMVEAIVKGWTPERDEELNMAARRRAREQEKEPLAQVSEQRGSIEHYLYFPKKNQAEKAAQRLKAKGWPVEVRMGSDGENWLALARQSVPMEDQIEAVREELEGLAEDLGGEYDGWGTLV